MTKTWNGPTPYDAAIKALEDKMVRTRNDLWLIEGLRAHKNGYESGITDPRVIALHEWLRLYVNFLDGGGDVPDTLMAMGVLAAYEAGMRDAEELP